MMQMQTTIHTAVQGNNFEMQLQAWAYWIPFSFLTNLFNYAHYGTFYLETLKNSQKNYPGLNELLRTTGLSVQGQGWYAHRTAIDQHDKQAINRDAKTSGKILFSLCMLWINLYNILRLVMSLCLAFLHNFVWLDIKNDYNGHNYYTDCIILYCTVITDCQYITIIFLWQTVLTIIMIMKLP